MSNITIIPLLWNLQDVERVNSALNNPRVSEEAKQNASNAIDNYENRGNEAAEDFSNEVDNNTHHSSRAVGGYKA